MVNSFRGRPAGGSDARDRLLTAAQQAFLRDGYAGVSVRAVAREAEVSHTLVNYYFGSKEGLFGEVMAINLRPSRMVAQALAAPEGASPTRRAHIMLETLLSVWENRTLSDPLLDILRQAVGSDALRSVIAEFIEDEIFAQFADHIGGRDARARAAAVACVMSGTIFTRYVLAVGPIATLPAPELARSLAPMIAIHLR